MFAFKLEDFIIISLFRVDAQDPVSLESYLGMRIILFISWTLCTLRFPGFAIVRKFRHAFPFPFWKKVDIFAFVLADDVRRTLRLRPHLLLQVVWLFMFKSALIYSRFFRVFRLFEEISLKFARQEGDSGLVFPGLGATLWARWPIDRHPQFDFSCQPLVIRKENWGAEKCRPQASPVMMSGWPKRTPISPRSSSSKPAFISSRLPTPTQCEKCETIATMITFSNSFPSNRSCCCLVVKENWIGSGRAMKFVLPPRDRFQEAWMGKGQTRTGEDEYRWTP